MSTEIQYPHLKFDPDGTLRIGETRYKVVHLAAEHYQHGWTAEELLRQHPDLHPGQVYAALAYFYDHREAMIDQMKASLAASATARSVSQVSRDTLIARQVIHLPPV